MYEVWVLHDFDHEEELVAEFDTIAEAYRYKAKREILDGPTSRYEIKEV